MANSSWLQTPAKNNIAIRLDWTQSQDIVNNKSTINFNIYGVDIGSRKSWANVYQVKVWCDDLEGNSSVVWSTSTMVKTYGGTSIVNGASFTVPHNTDGSRSIHLWLEAGITTSSINVSTDYVWNLDNIPRAATITSTTNFNDEQDCYITYSNPAGSTAQIKACLTSWNLEDAYVLKAWQTLDPNGSAANLTFSSQERTYIRQWLKNSTSGTAYVYLRTTIGGYTQDVWKEVSVSIVNSAITIAPTAWIDKVSYELTKNWYCVIGNYSNIEYALVPNLKKEATLSSFTITCGSQYTASAQTGVFERADSGTIVFTATDSRGYTATITKTLSYIDYIPLSCDIDTEADVNGNLNLTVSGKCFNGKLGDQSTSVQNELTLWYRLTTNGVDGEWKELTDKTQSGNNYSASYTITGLSYKDNYQIQASARDTARFTSYGESGDVYSAKRDASCRPVFQWGKENFTVNVPFYHPESFPTYPRTVVSDGTMNEFNMYGYCWSRWGNTAGRVSERGDNYYIMVGINNTTSALELWVGKQINNETSITWEKH